jgi:hypothetical protein
MVSALSKVISSPARFIFCQVVAEDSFCFIDTLSTPAPGDAVAVPLGDGITASIEAFSGQPILGAVLMADSFIPELSIAPSG